MLQFVLSVVFFLISLLTVFMAPTNALWKISIAAMEWGHWFALIALSLVFFNHWNFGVLGKIGKLSAIAAVLLYVSPLCRALLIEASVKTDTDKTWGKPEQESSPISLSRLLKGQSYKKDPPAVMPYTAAQDPDHSMQFYPARKRNAPCVLVVHGGGWDSGDFNQLSELNYWLVEKGYAVASLNYRLAPKFHFPEQLSDILTAKEYLKQNAESFGIDSTKLVWLGRSAGGQLALMAATLDKDPSVKGTIAFYTPADLVWGYSIPGNPWIMDSRLVLRNYIGATPDERKDLFENASANYHCHSEMSPVLLLHGKPDVMVAFHHSEKMDAELTKCGIPHQFVQIPWATHGYDYVFNGPASQLSNYAIEGFLKNRFGN